MHQIHATLRSSHPQRLPARNMARFQTEHRKLPTVSHRLQHLILEPPTSLKTAAEEKRGAVFKSVLDDICHVDKNNLSVEKMHETVEIAGH